MFFRTFFSVSHSPFSLFVFCLRKLGHNFGFVTNLRHPGRNCVGFASEIAMLSAYNNPLHIRGSFLLKCCTYRSRPSLKVLAASMAFYCRSLCRVSSATWKHRESVWSHAKSSLMDSTFKFNITRTEHCTGNAQFEVVFWSRLCVWYMFILNSIILTLTNEKPYDDPICLQWINKQPLPLRRSVPLNYKIPRCEIMNRATT